MPTSNIFNTFRISKLKALAHSNSNAATKPNSADKSLQKTKSAPPSASLMGKSQSKSKKPTEISVSDASGDWSWIPTPDHHSLNLDAPTPQESKPAPGVLWLPPTSPTRPLNSLQDISGAPYSLSYTPSGLLEDEADDHGRSSVARSVSLRSHLQSAGSTRSSLRYHVYPLYYTHPGLYDDYKANPEPYGKKDLKRSKTAPVPNDHDQSDPWRTRSSASSHFSHLGGSNLVIFLRQRSSLSPMVFIPPGQVRDDGDDPFYDHATPVPTPTHSIASTQNRKRRQSLASRPSVPLRTKRKVAPRRIQSYPPYRTVVNRARPARRRSTRSTSSFARTIESVPLQPPRPTRPATSSSLGTSRKRKKGRWKHYYLPPWQSWSKKPGYFGPEFHGEL